MSKKRLASGQYNELKPFKEESKRYDAPLGKQSLELQRSMVTLNVSREELMEGYGINESQLKDFLFGSPEKSDEGKFFNIYYDFKNKVDEKKKESNKKALVKLLNSGKAFEKKIFYKLFRSVLGITQKEFSEIVNMNISTIRSWEQGNSTASGSSQMLIYMALPKEIKNQLNVNKGKEDRTSSHHERIRKAVIRTVYDKPTKIKFIDLERGERRHEIEITYLEIENNRNNRRRPINIENLERVSEIVKELN